MIRRTELPFEWECFYHFEDLVYCVARAWEALLLLYIVCFLFFVAIAACMIVLRRKQRKRRDERTRTLASQSIGPYAMRIPDIP